MTDATLETDERPSVTSKLFFISVSILSDSVKSVRPTPSQKEILVTHEIHRPTFGTSALMVSLVLVAASCGSGSSDPRASDAVAQAGATTELESVDTIAFGAAPATEFVRSLSEITVAYTTKGMTSGEWNAAALDEAIAYFDPNAGPVDLSIVQECSRQQGAAMAATVVDVYELKHEGFKAYEVTPDLWVIAYRVVEVVPGVSDITSDRAMYVTSGGIIGERSPGLSEDRSCWNSGMARTAVENTLFAAAAEADIGNLDPAPDDVDLDLAISGFTPDGTSTSNDSVFTRRDGIPADPGDPEPIGSTGADKRDILLASDPSVFECLSYLGRGTEEILSRDKSVYEVVPDAFLFVAKFGDGTTIDIRVHPEVGTLEEATSEVAKYTTPLGQLPTVLRRDIGRFAIRLGDETATASPLEGISMQTGNTAVRLADNRLEETIFHESVHTSLDPTYVHGSATEWFDAQDLDGRFLTEYGRNNPDGEDLAETALYAYVLAYHPDRIPAGEAATYRERIPNRMAFIESILPPGQPIFGSVPPSPTCEPSE